MRSRVNLVSFVSFRLLAVSWVGRWSCGLSGRGGRLGICHYAPEDFLHCKLSANVYRRPIEGIQPVERC